MTNWLEEAEENYNIHEQELEEEAYEEKQKIRTYCERTHCQMFESCEVVLMTRGIDALAEKMKSLIKVHVEYNESDGECVKLYYTDNFTYTDIDEIVQQLKEELDSEKC